MVIAAIDDAGRIIWANAPDFTNRTLLLGRHGRFGKPWRALPTSREARPPVDPA